MKYLLALLVCATCFGQVVEDQCELKIETPSLKERAVRKLRLENGLEVVVISDPSTPRSGAALAVNVGSWDDPDNRPGMAHFVEHLLFLGTEKYPEEEGYTRYLDEHGGERNAYTMSDRTVYFFSVNHGGFPEALDRFGHFFIDPLFSPSGVDRECKAIHQEYCKDVPLDPWRHVYVKKELCRDNHPMHRFCIGNSDTLAQISQDELKNWYEHHYGANLMHLVVLSPQPIDVMEEQVRSLFSQVRTTDFSPSTTLPPVLSEKTSGKLVAIAPLQQVQILDLTWEIPTQHIDVRADRLVGYLLGHEGEGSLYAALHSAGLADHLSAGSSNVGKNQMMFSIQIHLTDQGLKDYEKVISMCYGALARYRLTGIPRSLFEEVGTCNTLQYTYQSREDVASFVSDSAASMIDEPLETFPQKQILCSTYNHESISEILAVMTPDRCLFTLMAPPEKTKLKCDRKEPWLGVDYTVKPISKRKLKNWSLSAPHPSTSLPKQNLYLPENLELIGKESVATKPICLENEAGICYIEQDREFGVPHVSWSMTIKTPTITPGNAKASVLADLYCHTVEQRLNQTAYLATLGGLTFSLSPVSNGIALHVNGFNDKAGVFLEEILTALKTTSVSKEEFEQYSDLAKRVYANEYSRSPVSEANELLKGVLYQDYCGSAQKERVLKSLTYDEMKKFSRNLFNQTYLEVMLCGNMKQEGAEQIWQMLCHKIHSAPYAKSNHPHIAVAHFDSVHLLNHKTNQLGNAVILAADLGSFSFEKRAAMDILCKGLEEPFFSELRTKQQTAYLVRNWGRELERHLYAMFVVQSSSHDTRDLLSRFELFLESNLRELQSEAIPKERFEMIKVALIERLKNPSHNLQEKGQLLNLLAFEYEGDFDWLEKRIASFENLSYERFIQLSHDFLGSSEPKRVAICVNGQIPAESGVHYQTASSIDKLRKKMTYKGKMQ